MEPEMAGAGAGAAAAAAAPPPPPQLKLDPGREGAGDTMNRRRRAARATLDELPTPGEYRAAVASAGVYRPKAGAPKDGGGGSRGDDEDDTGPCEEKGSSPSSLFFPATLADASDALAVHTALHLAGRRAAVRRGGGERGGVVLLAGPKEGEEEEEGEGGEGSSSFPSTGDALADGEAALREAARGGAGAAADSSLPRGWEVVVPVSTACASLTPARLAAAALAPATAATAAATAAAPTAATSATPYVVLALVDRDGTCGFSRLYPGIRAPDGAPDRGAEDEEAVKVGGGDGGGGRGGRGGRGGNGSRGRRGGRGRGRVR